MSRTLNAYTNEKVLAVTETIQSRNDVGVERSRRPLDGAVVVRNLLVCGRTLQLPAAQCPADGARCDQHVRLRDMAASKHFVKVRPLDPIAGIELPL